MAYIPWNAGTPIGTEPASTIDEIIVEVKAQVAERGDDLTDTGGKWSADDPVKLSKTAYNAFVDLENLQHWSVGNPATSETDEYTTIAGGSGTSIVGIRPTNTVGGLLTWQMPVVLAPGYTITGYKAKVDVPDQGGAFVSLEFFRVLFGADDVAPVKTSLGSTGSITGPGFRNIEITGLSQLVVATHSYYAEIVLKNATTGPSTWFYAGGPVYDAPDLATRI